MNRISRAFSRLFLLAIIGVVGVILWERFVPPAPPPTLVPIEGRIDRIVVAKAARTMTVFQGGTPVRTYQIALGFAPDGDKEQEGDGRTPEGTFKIDRRNGKSAFHLSLGLDYPRPEDIARARQAGVSPGGDIFIHGQPNGMGQFGTIKRDWTAGCIAVSDVEIEELWSITPIGTEVEIRP
ncbi:L,D-transpeptidase catalytic domain [Aliiroseovarius halocynthiae]|uniref:L,D-transpeptidase family protein n=1 Tax=Aliiroseovarius halocynthiae TaxID=985055 RepID=A0A545SN32_9RHOB|nr:L,D-transpeptidase family protein [Aliiroseovarius halocynthiae]TQV66371.1 L,D-transpeptidase family protein [Aliiroseovarius halocynthiae]SMR83346.1 L,D-transpeptidase catalytic domain [Aliiroseovarius halocynthiae]